MANYRDDRDALRDRADVLAQELDGAKAELGRKDAELAKNEAELARLRKLAGERPPPSNGKRVALLASITGSFVILGGVISMTLLTKAAPPAVIVASPPPIEATPIPVEAPATPQPEVPVVETHATFGAKVKSVVGRTDVRVGQVCSILLDAESRPGGDKVDQIAITCDGVPLYELSNMKGSITSMTSWAYGPVSAEDPEHFVLRFEDLGPRSSEARPQISLSSEQGVARIFSDGVTRMEVVFSMDKVGKRYQPLK